MPIERKLAAIMFTDIAGYTEQMSKDEAVAISLLNKKESVLKPLIAKHNGTYVKSTGDGSLSHFNSAIDAATCAKRLQESIYDDKDLNVRVGVHLGDTIFEKGDIRGDGVNIASRLESMAVEGGVFVSKEVHDQLANQKEFEGVSLGMQTLKGVGRLIEVYGLKGDKLNEPDPKNYEKDYCGCHSDDEVPSVVILPFKNKGNDDDEFYSYGIWLDLITEVSGAGLIRVASKKQIDEVGDVSIKEISNKLCVRYIVNGELWKLENKFQLFIELYDTKESKVVWTDKWQENWENLSTIKGNLSDGLLKALSTKPKEKQIETNNPKAYEYYLKGLDIYRVRKNKDDFDSAKVLIKKSIEIDNDFYPAKILLNNIYVTEGNLDKAEKLLIKLIEKSEINNNKRALARSYYYYADINRLNANMSSAIHFGEKALKIFQDLNNKEFIIKCYSSLTLYFHMIGKYTEAMDYTKKSIIMLKNIGDKEGRAYQYYQMSSIYSKLGHYDNALKYINQSIKHIFNNTEIDLQRKRAIEFEIYQICSYRGDFAKAIKHFIMHYEISKNRNDVLHCVASLWQIGEAYLVQEKNKNALKYIEKALAINDNTPFNEISFQLNVICNLAKKRLSISYSNQIIKDFFNNSELGNHPFCRSYRFTYNYFIYELLEDMSYLETAYNKVQEKADNLEPDVAAKFLSYPIPKAIVEEWEKVK